ncbi:MAG: MBL fold metallo-hydrolase [Alphaproteobacteria bacterium]
MTLRVTVLGCGSSGGVPLIGERWGICDPKNPKNRRRRASILLELADTSVLVDTGPDLRAQINDLDRGEGGLQIDAVLYTHEHADHVSGIDDIRFLAYSQNGQISAYAKDRCKDVLERRFDYIFKGIDGAKLSYPPIMKMHLWPDRLQVGSMTIDTWEQEHGDITSQGVRVGNFAYSTDISNLSSSNLEALIGIDTWIVGCIRKEPHPGHASLDQIIKWAEVVQPRRLLFTHMTGLIDYDKWNAETPSNMECAYDGQVLELPTQ